MIEVILLSIFALGWHLVEHPANPQSIELPAVISQMPPGNGGAP